MTLAKEFSLLLLVDIYDNLGSLLSQAAAYHFGISLVVNTAGDNETAQGDDLINNRFQGKEVSLCLPVDPS